MRSACAVVPLSGLVLFVEACAAGGLEPATHAAAAHRLLLVDVDADPLRLGGFPGALYEIDAQSHAPRLLCSSREFVDPVDVLADRDGSLLVLDANEMRGDGRILRVSDDGKSVRRVALPESLVAPTAFARAPDETIWVCDRGESFAHAPGPGAVFRFSPDLAHVDVVASGSPIVTPSDVCFVDARAYVLDADSFRRDVADLSEGGLFATGLGGGALETVAPLHLLSPFSLQPWRDGSFLIADVNADPDVRRRFRGAVYLFEPARGVSLFARDDGWRGPSCALLWNGQLLVVDGSSDPLGLGDDPTGRGFGGKGRGGVYAVDLATRAVSLFCASPDFINPVRLRIVP
jgi:hypothetical protein